MPDIQPPVRPNDPAQIITAAINEAHLRGHVISADADYPGVVLASTHIPAWERDSRAAVLSPLGAVLLHKQIINRILQPCGEWLQYRKTFPNEYIR